MPAPASECQAWPCRPWPASWRSARTMVPGSQVAAMRCVESTESKCRIWRSGKARRRRARSIMEVLRQVAQALVPAVSRLVSTPVRGRCGVSKASVGRSADAAGKSACATRSSYQLQAEAQVHGAGGMGDSAGRDEIGAHIGVVAHVGEGDAAGEFHLGAAGDFADPIGGLVGGEVVQQEVLRAAFQGPVEFLAGADLDRKSIV